MTPFNRLFLISLRAGLVAWVLGYFVSAHEGHSAKSSKEALKNFNNLIGNWRGIGQMDGSGKKDFWTETISWSWQFQGEDVGLVATFEKGRFFNRAELRFLHSQNLYQLGVQTRSGETNFFTGIFTNDKLTVEQADAASGEVRRVVLSPFNDGRFVYQFEVKTADKTSFSRRYQVGATIEGTPLARDFTGPECIVTGGMGTIRVSYAGKDYFVCCSGCKEDFDTEPEKVIKEYAERKAAERRR